MKYIIYSPGYRENSGGIVVLHTLGKELQDRGHTVYMLSPNTKEGLQTISVEHAKKIKDECWIIYPEIINGNPLQASNVVRWVLNTPGFIGGNSNTWQNTDLIYLLWDYFNLDPNIRVDGYLRVWDFKLDYFENQNKERIIDSYMIRKAAGRAGSRTDILFDKHPPNAVKVDGEIANNFKLLKDTLNISKTFISYDPITYYSLIAALCGATSIIIPDGVNTKEDLIKKVPIYKYGIAYGIEDLDWAEKTKHKVRDYLIEFEQESKYMIDSFIKQTESKFRYRFINLN